MKLLSLGIDWLDNGYNSFDLENFLNVDKTT